MNMTADKLYALLPAIHRIRDEELGKPLQALIGVLAEQAGVLETDIAHLYNNWFIETCEEWVVPYIGDLIDVRGLNPVSSATFSERARVADTIGYRRRKGTAAMLQQLARDTTGWPARVVEYFELLSTTQYINHLRPGNFRTPDLRNTAALELIGTPFDPAAHTADVRHINDGRGKYNIQNIGIFLWRLEHYPIVQGDARAESAHAGCFTFNPLGINAPLFSAPIPETDETHINDEKDLPSALRRRPLYDELEALRESAVDGSTPTEIYFTPANPVLTIAYNGGAAIKPEQIMICDLSAWHLPPSKKTYSFTKPDGTVVKKIKTIIAAVDPKLGRIAFCKKVHPVNEVLLDYNYGFSGDLGGGPYNRATSVDALSTLDGEKPLMQNLQWIVGVTKNSPTVAGKIFATLQAAVDAWNALPATTELGAIVMMDSRTYHENISGAHKIIIPNGKQLLIVAGECAAAVMSGGTIADITQNFSPIGQRPHLFGNVEVAGTPTTAGVPGGELIVNGLLIEGNATVKTGSLGSLRAQHSTIAPVKTIGKILVETGNDNLALHVEFSICRAIEVSSVDATVAVSDSIVTEHNDFSIRADQNGADLQRSTFFGKVSVQSIEAGNCIFQKLLQVQRLQTGCVRYCYLPVQSIAPRRFRCQPEFALTGVKEAHKRMDIITRIQPSFTASHFGDPAFAQLATAAPVEISSGGENGTETGAWNFLMQPQREINLRASFDEYLRFGLEAGIFFAT